MPAAPPSGPSSWTRSCVIRGLRNGVADWSATTISTSPTAPIPRASIRRRSPNKRGRVQIVGAGGDGRPPGRARPGRGSRGAPPGRKPVATPFPISARGRLRRCRPAARVAVADGAARVLMVLPPETDGFGIILLDPECRTRTFVHQRSGSRRIRRARRSSPVHSISRRLAGRRPPSSPSPISRRPPRRCSERDGTALINGNPCAPAPEPSPAGPSTCTVTAKSTGSGARQRAHVLALPPVMEATDDKATCFYIHTVAVGADRFQIAAAATHHRGGRSRRRRLRVPRERASRALPGRRAGHVRSAAAHRPRPITQFQKSLSLRKPAPR